MNFPIYVILIMVGRSTGLAHIFAEFICVKMSSFVGFGKGTLQGRVLKSLN